MKMKSKFLVLACAVVAASAMSASAATYDAGDLTGTTITESNILRTQTVDFFNFTLDAPSGYKLSTLDITMTSEASSNLWEAVALYYGSSLLKSISKNYGEPKGGASATLSFTGADALAEGSYTVALAGWKAQFTPMLENVGSTANFGNGNYTVNIASTVSAVPLPAGGMLLLTALGALGIARRKTRNA